MASFPQRKLIEDAFEGVRLRMPVDKVDIAAQRQKFERHIERFQKRLDSIDQRLNNPSFLEKADPEAVEDNSRTTGQQRPLHWTFYKRSLDRLGGLVTMADELSPAR